MIFIFTNTIRKIIAITCTAATMLTCVNYAPVIFGNGSSSAVISASAESGISTPSVSTLNVYSNKIELSVDNLAKYSKDVKFKVYVSGNYVKSYTVETLKEKKFISIFHNGKNNLKADTKYTVEVYAVKGKEKTKAKKIIVKTPSVTYYQIGKSVQMYNFSNKKYTKADKTSSVLYVKGVLCDKKGRRICGKSCKEYEGTYLLINEGENKGKYVKVDSNICRVTERTAKIQKVVKYAIGMDGGRYVYGGESYRATDCSGLTMLSYKQIGVDLSHSVRAQASVGKASSMSSLNTGDIIICNNYGHAALYIGNGKMIHAMSSSYGIRIQNVSKISYCGRVNTVRTII